MKTELLHRLRTERYIFGVLISFVMFFAAELTGESEIIFPEICALTIGAWISEQQPWETNKRRIFLLMTAAAIFGVAVVRYVPVPLIFQVCLCFCFTGVILTISKTNFVPIISACILPVYLGTKSIIYPAAVSFSALIIIFAQYLMEKYCLRPVNKFEPCFFDMKKQMIKWSKLSAVFALIALIPFKTEQIYFLAPPLIVMFTELSDTKSKARNRPLYVVGIMIFAAFTGCFVRLIFNVLLNFPLYVSTAISCIILFCALHKIRLFFPPAGAILLIPMILDKNLLTVFPFEAGVGAIILCTAALLLFRPVEKNKNIIL